MMQAAIVDDEPLARARLKRMLGAANVEVVAEGENGQQALDIVRKHRLDLLVIDINMPSINGMDAVRQIEGEMDTPPAIMFCTAYDQYAVEAFKTNAVAYLLKPFSQAELEQALHRVEKKTEVRVATTAAETSHRLELVMHYKGQLQKVDVRNIVYFFSQDKAVYAVMKNADQVLVDKPLKELESIVGDRFIRLHRAFLAQTMELQALLKTDQGNSVSLRSSQQELPLSRRHLKEVKQCFVQ